MSTGALGARDERAKTNPKTAEQRPRREKPSRATLASLKRVACVPRDVLHDGIDKKTSRSGEGSREWENKFCFIFCASATLETSCFNL